MALPLRYNWQNLFVRKLTTALTILVVGFVVLTLVLLLSFGEGIRATVAGSGRADNLLVINAGATAESMSLIFQEDAQPLMQTPGVALGPDGQPLVSRELCVQTGLRRNGKEGSLANVAVRGVDDIAFAVHDAVRVIEGRTFTQGAREAIVGKGAAQRYTGIAIGDKLQLGRAENHVYTIVGVFAANGSSFESEVWAPRSMIGDSYVRRFSSSVVMRLTSPDRAADAAAYVNGPTVRLKGVPETEYYRDLSDKSYQVVQLFLGMVLIMGIGAVFAVANTMYSAVDGRRREIALLRTIGFSRRAIIMAFLIESMMICAFACGLGILASLYFSGYREDVLSNTTWTVTGFELRITPLVCLSALLVSTLVGIIGALAPALKASRVRIIEALRKA